MEMRKEGEKNQFFSEFCPVYTSLKNLVKSELESQGENEILNCHSHGPEKRSWSRAKRTEKYSDTLRD